MKLNVYNLQRTEADNTRLLNDSSTATVYTVHVECINAALGACGHSLYQ